MAEWTNELEDRERDIFLNRVAYNANLTVKDLPKQTKRAGSEACITNFLSTWNLTQYMRKRGKPDLKDLEYWLRCSMVSAKGSNPWVMQYGWASKQIKIKAGFSYWNGGAMDNFGMLGEDYSGGKFENSPLRHVTFPEGLRRLYYAARTGVYAFWGTPGSGHAKDYKRVYSGYGVPHAFQNAGGSDYDKGDETSFAGWPGRANAYGKGKPYNRFDLAEGCNDGMFKNSIWDTWPVSAHADDSLCTAGGYSVWARVDGKGLKGRYRHWMKWPGIYWMANFYATFMNTDLYYSGGRYTHRSDQSSTGTDSGWFKSYSDVDSGKAISKAPNIYHVNPYIPGADTGTGTFTTDQLNQGTHEVEISGWEEWMNYRYNMYKVIEADYQKWSSKGKPSTWAPKADSQEDVKRLTFIIYWWWQLYSPIAIKDYKTQSGWVGRFQENSPAYYPVNWIRYGDHHYPLYFGSAVYDYDSASARDDAFYFETFGETARAPNPNGDKYTEADPNFIGDASKNGYSRWYKSGDRDAYFDAVHNWYESKTVEGLRDQKQFGERIKKHLKSLPKKIWYYHHSGYSRYWHAFGNNNKYAVDKPWGEMINKEKIYVTNFGSNKNSHGSNLFLGRNIENPNLDWDSSMKFGDSEPVKGLPLANYSHHKHSGTTPDYNKFPFSMNGWWGQMGSTDIQNTKDTKGTDPFINSHRLSHINGNTKWLEWNVVGASEFVSGSAASYHARKNHDSANWSAQAPHRGSKVWIDEWLKSEFQKLIPGDHPRSYTIHGNLAERISKANSGKGLKELIIKQYNGTEQGSSLTIDLNGKTDVEDIADELEAYYSDFRSAIQHWIEHVADPEKPANKELLEAIRCKNDSAGTGFNPDKLTDWDKGKDGTEAGMWREFIKSVWDDYRDHHRALMDVQKFLNVVDKKMMADGGHATPEEAWTASTKGLLTALGKDPTKHAKVGGSLTTLLTDEFVVENAEGYETEYIWPLFPIHTIGDGLANDPSTHNEEVDYHLTTLFDWVRSLKLDREAYHGFTMLAGAVFGKWARHRPKSEWELEKALEIGRHNNDRGWSNPVKERYWSGSGYANMGKASTLGYQYGLDTDIWSLIAGEGLFKKGPKGGFFWPTADDIFDDYTASLATQIAAYLGAIGTQAYINSLIAGILFSGADEELSGDDIDDAEADAQGLSGTSASQEELSYELSEDEVKARQKFFEQCALLLSMEKFVPSHLKQIYMDMKAINSSKTKNIKTVHSTYPYEGRFWMVKDGDSDQNSLINKFFVPSNLSSLLNLHPSVAAMLVPKVRLFKVFDNEEGIAQQVEFEFDQAGLGGWDAATEKNTSPKNRIDNILNSTFDRGNGAGIKSFNFSFEGTSPATARNDITADLVLFFQNFNDFFRQRKNSLKEEYKFVDLVLYPKSTKKVGYGVASKNQYDPSYYRIRADVGWVPPDGKTISEINKISGAGTGEQLRKEIKQTNKSFYLNMVDHDISLKEDGTVEIKISYRAYIESLFKSNRLDALESVRIREKRKEREDKLNEAREKECSNVEIMAVKNELLKQEQALAQLSQQSIMKRLFEYNRVYWCELHRNAKKQFEINGFFVSKPYFYKGNQLAKMAVDDKRAGGGNPSTSEVESWLDDDGLINFRFIEEKIGWNNRIHYFFLGDLIYTILDALYDDKDPLKYRDSTLKNTKLILGSFDYYDFDGNKKMANLANIPISCHYFFEWFTQNIVKPKRTGYPVMYFIRDLCNQLINSLFGTLCRGQPLERKVRFNTGNFMAPGYAIVDKDHEPPKVYYKDQFNKMVGRWTSKSNKTGTGGHILPNGSNAIVDVNNWYTGKNPRLPLFSTSHDRIGIEGNFNYILVYALQSPVVEHPGNGNPNTDLARGVHHFHIGSRQGIVKKINFAKTDIQYIRESRFLNQGDQGLLQLGSVYKVTVDMIGNTIWYPGMEIYINPLGIGGTEFGDPNNYNSIANKLGFGGYHLVTRVKNQIAPGKFSTSLEAQFHYSGAPQDQAQRLGQKPLDEDETKNIEDGTYPSGGPCDSMITSLENETDRIIDEAGIEDIESE